MNDHLDLEWAYGIDLPETVTRSEAIEEIRLHSCCVVEFIEDLGNHAEYSAAAVLGWLGY
tara:strand:+ start:299 stop:478 length:180 start_codon:yes stop_codon:yes gene_type:complete